MTRADMRDAVRPPPVTFIAPGERELPDWAREAIETAAPSIESILLDGPVDAAVLVTEREGSLVIEGYHREDLAARARRAGLDYLALRLAEPPAGARRWLVLQSLTGATITLCVRRVGTLAPGGSA